MINECLRGYIGIPGCTDEPESGKYITDHPGISVLSLDKIADSDKQTWKSVWSTIEKRGIDRLTSDIVSWFSQKYKLKKLVENVKLPKDVVQELTVADGTWKGFDIELGSVGQNYAYSSLQIVRLQEIRFYSNVVASVEFRIMDLTFSTVLETKTVSVVQGWNTIFQNKEFSVYHLGVEVKATIDLVETEFESNTCCDFCSDICSGKISGTDGNTFGLSGEISIGCGFDGFICQNKAMFAQALWYAEGIETLRERIYTERLNKWTTVDRAIAKEEMLPDFNKNYARELDQLVSGIDLCDCCLECESQVSYQQAVM